NVQPRVLNADAAMLEVLPDVDTSYDPTTPLRIVVIAHIFYVEMTNEILDRADTLPADYDLVVTTPEQERADAIRELVSARPSAPRNVEIRVVRNEGRDQSAFLIGCRDILQGDRYDLVVKLHSKKTPQDGFNVGRYFKDQQFANLLNSPGYAANMVALFQREPGLGLAYPPTIHVGYPTMGRGWWSNKAGFERIAGDLGIRVPLDEISPLAPYGSMYFARPQALRLLIGHEWSYDDFGGAEAYQDGGLAHILERVPSYAAAELGYHTRTVASTEHLAISHTAFDFNLDQMSATMAGFTIDQIHFLKRAGYVGDGSLSDFVRMYRRMGYPGSSLLGVLSAARRRLVRWAGRARSALARTKG
ncbi:UNVERIFIED_CONTAM: rhamnan synthesis F family protein, partial [Microbacterium sp. SLM126]